MIEYPNDAATHMSGLEEHEIVEIMQVLPFELETEVFIYFEPEVQESIVIGSGWLNVSKPQPLSSTRLSMVPGERIKIPELLSNRNPTSEFAVARNAYSAYRGLTSM